MSSDILGPAKKISCPERDNVMVFSLRPAQDPGTAQRRSVAWQEKKKKKDKTWRSKGEKILFSTSRNSAK